MSFLSMLNSAKGQEPPPDQIEKIKSKPSSSGTSKTSKPAAKAPTKLATKLPTKLPTKPVQTPSINIPQHKPKTRPPPPTLNRSKSNPIQAMKNKYQTAKAKPIVSARPTQTTHPKRSASNTILQSSRQPVKEVYKEPVESRQKLSFKEMMKRGAQIDKSKLELSFKTKDPKSAPPKPVKSRRSKPEPIDSAEPETHHQQGSQYMDPNKRSPAPIAQPLPSVLAKIKSKQNANRQPHDSGSDLDDFVDSEDDNQYGSRQYTYASDSESDMEATGGDIFAEEMRSAAQARREDLLEERKLEELARIKRQRR